MADSSQDSNSLVNPFDDADGDDSASTSSAPPPRPPPQDDEIWTQEQLENAFAFVKLVDDTMDRPNFREFMQLPVDFNGKRIGEAEVCGRAKELLKDHPNLLQGLFAVLLSPILNPIINKTPGGLNNTWEECQKFMKKVKIRFQNNKDIYQAFLDRIEDFHGSKISMVQVVERVSNLFKGNEDLIEEFRNFIKADDDDSNNR